MSTPTTPYATGAILKGTWGYDQTNVDFYEVLKRSGNWLTLRKLKTVETEYSGQSMTGRATPGDPTGETLRRKLVFRDGKPVGCKFEPGYGWISAWDGKPASFSCYA
jgi:hypothetical protein